MANQIKKKDKAPKASQRNKSKGRITESRKGTSSRNTTTHSATSPKLLNYNEHHRYTSLLAKLKESYPNPNPLIRTQLERIAKLRVQMERIQNVIDAQFQMSRATSNIYDTPLKILDINQKKASLIVITIFWLNQQ